MLVLAYAFDPPTLPTDLKLMSQTNQIIMISPVLGDSLPQMPLRLGSDDPQPSALMRNYRFKTFLESSQKIMLEPVS